MMNGNGNKIVGRWIATNAWAIVRNAGVVFGALYLWGHVAGHSEASSAADHEALLTVAKALQTHIDEVRPLTREFTDMKAKTDARIDEIMATQKEIKAAIEELRVGIRELTVTRGRP